MRQDATVRKDGGQPLASNHKAWTTTGKQPQSVDNHCQASAKRRETGNDLKQTAGFAALGGGSLWEQGGAGRECMLCVTRHPTS